MLKGGKRKMEHADSEVKGATDFKEIMLGKERDFGLEKKRMEEFQGYYCTLTATTQSNLYGF